MINSNTVFGTIRQGVLDSAYIWKNEFKTIFKDGGVMIFLFLLPFGYPLIYGLIYNPETPHDLPIVIVDESRSVQSRKFARMLDATSEAKIVAYAANLDEAKKLLAEQKAYGIFCLDRDFERNIYRGEQANVSFYCMVNSLLYYRNLLTAGTNVTAAFNNVLAEEKLAGATLKQQSMAIGPVQSVSISMFNPLSGFATFIMPAIEMLVLQQSLLLAIGMLAGTQRERNRFHELIPFNHKYFGTFRVILGKAMCFLSISLLASLWTLYIVPVIFKFPRLGNFWEIQMFILPFLLASIFLGMTLSCIIRGREMPMLFYVFLSILLLFISGITWPWASIPTFWKIIGAIIPSTYGIQGFVQLNSTGASLTDVSFYYIVEWVLCFVYFISACLVYRYQLSKSIKMIDNIKENHDNINTYSLARD
ncbi:MAG: ABC transporter permease [Bacteroidales bacterium]|nr:ABC transporter permease [Bacteroidales bacterium]